MARITVELEGKGAMTLNDTDHRATGGEGAVYVKKGYAIKLFLDPAHARRTGMAEKIRALAGLRHPAIVAPLGAVYDTQQAMVGFYMPEVHGVPLVKTFTNAWRDAQGFDDAQALRLVDGMREAVIAAHQQGALLVDGNEMNYLVDGGAPRLIDVDSWQIGSFKATAQMPSIRDHHSSTFDEGTDWFAWAIVSFQVLVGIHPYKGTHPDFKKSDLEARMKANASVFDSRVKLNAAVRDFARIPSLLRDWYEAVFQHGLRTAPPSAFARATGVVRAAPFVRRAVAVGAGAVRHEVLDILGGPVRLLTQGWAVARTPHGWSAFDLVRRQPIPALDSPSIEAVLQGRAVLVRHGLGWAWLTTDGQTVSGHRVSGANEPVPHAPALNRLACQGERLLVWGERAFVLVPDSERGLVELGLDTLGDRTMISIKGRWPVLVRSTQFFDGAAVMDALGTPFLAVPSPGAVTVRRAPELHGMRVLDAYARHPDFALVLALSPLDGRTHRLTFAPATTGDRWTVTEDEVTDAVALNVAINARGILVSIPEDGLLRVVNTHGQGGKLVQDSSLSTDQRLVAWGDGLGYARGDEVVRLSMT